MSTTEGGLRERKKRETRLALSQATIRLALAHGLENVSVEDIAAEANVSERTFRNYFSNKAEAVVANHVERGRRTAAALRARPADEPLWDALVHAVVEQFEPPGGTPPRPDDAYASALRALLATPAVQHEVFRAHATSQRELAAAVAERTGTEPEDLYPGTVAAVVGAGLGSALTHWTRDPRQSLVALLREVFDQIRTGMPAPSRNPPGRTLGASAEPGPTPRRETEGNP
ncbi:MULTISPECIES: acyl-CoA-like ligand-binding transcription factor [Actinoalloteichus]|uniref:Transcriptional regulator, TetR family n=1 Tax=Actinoalloteichus caeruleus DSM 43889 TaxID=1120930 RepID=A0ABT1JFT3_ACTCY|nr:TetR family transcriptional regulator [Actinoalloteichus caeruleus]MCP2330641.1 transcriptional regulator, TetR family [Actinoalloteichus caeruleus DSM 43889]